MFGTKIWDRKKISFHRCKIVFFLLFFFFFAFSMSFYSHAFLPLSLMFCLPSPSLDLVLRYEESQVGQKVAGLSTDIAFILSLSLAASASARPCHFALLRELGRICV